MNKKECSLIIVKEDKVETILISKLDMVVLSELKKHEELISSSDLLKINNIKNIVDRQSLNKIVTRLSELGLIYKILISNHNHLKISDIVDKNSIPNLIIHRRK